MQPARPILCPACGTAVSIDGGRCPSCGTDLPSQAPPKRTPRRAARVVRHDGRTAATLLTLAGALVALAALGGGAWYLARTQTELGAASLATTPTAPPPASAIAEDGAPDLERALVLAKKRAEEWHGDAQLASFQVTAVDKGKIAESATIEFEFGRPKGNQLGPRAPLRAERFRVSVTDGAQSTSERRAGAASSVAEPNCPIEEVWRKMVSSGVPSNATVGMRYELASKHDRAVWVTSVAGRPELTRTLDGNTCAILAR